MNLRLCFTCFSISVILVAVEVIANIEVGKCPQTRCKIPRAVDEDLHKTEKPIYQKRRKTITIIQQVVDQVKINFQLLQPPTF